MKKKTIFKSVAIVAIAAMTMSVAANAQEQGDMAIGGNLVIGTGGGYSNFGVGAKLLYNVTDPIRLAAEFDFFPTQDGMSWWDFSAYGHYLFSIAEQTAVYPSVGLGMLGYKADVGRSTFSHSDFAFSLGGGIEHALTSNLVLNGEIRIKLYDGMNRTNFVVGVAYKF